MKIIEKIREKEKNKEVYYSFEFFPPRHDEGKYALYDRFDSMALLRPSFIDITWRLRTRELSIEVASTAQLLCGLETQIHLCVAGLVESQLIDILKEIKKSGIRNILALRGDPLDGQSEFKSIQGGFSYAHQLVKLIRDHYHDYFSVGVAGYPEGLGERSYEDDQKHLKQKVDQGADYIISQLFWDTKKFLRWVHDCRRIGIKVPIIAGILPIQSYRSFQSMSKLNPTVSVPPEITQAIEAIKNDDKAVREFGVKLCVDMCKKLREGGILGFHFYTLNLEASTAKILEELHFTPKEIQPPLPYKPCQNSSRKKEIVRPIFWANRPKSYIHRTKDWDEFPNGRWGDKASPAFGSLSDYHLFFLHVGQPGDRKNMWGENPTSHQDIYDTFVKYLEGKIDATPWYERKMEPETVTISTNLVKINKRGFLTINSQPAVNAVASNDKTFGWGPKDGYVYQKAYIEFFCPSSHLDRLINKMSNYPTLSYIAENRKGDILQNMRGVTAVTWGVFPNEEIIQPTIVDPVSFHVWKDEAFALWRSQWAALYEKGSASHAIIEDIFNTYWLVSIVDNDYIRGNIFAIFEEVEQEFVKLEQLKQEEQETKVIASSNNNNNNNSSSSNEEGEGEGEREREGEGEGKRLTKEQSEKEKETDEQKEQDANDESTRTPTNDTTPLVNIISDRERKEQENLEKEQKEGENKQHEIKNREKRERREKDMNHKLEEEIREKEKQQLKSGNKEKEKTKEKKRKKRKHRNADCLKDKDLKN